MNADEKLIKEIASEAAMSVGAFPREGYAAYDAAYRAAESALRHARAADADPEPSAHPDHSKLGPSACPACGYDPLDSREEPMPQDGA